MVEPHTPKEGAGFNFQRLFLRGLYSVGLAEGLIKGWMLAFQNRLGKRSFIGALTSGGLYTEGLFNGGVFAFRVGLYMDGLIFGISR